MQRAAVESGAALTMLRAGAVGIDPPSVLLASLQALRFYGPAGAALALAAQRHGDHVAVVDERGQLTYAEIDARADRLVTGLRTLGFEDGQTIGVLCRNHRGMLDALATTAKLGARTLLLNTDFSAPQLADVCGREGVALLVADQEFLEIATAAAPELGTVLAWVDDADTPGGPEGRGHDLPGASLDGLIAQYPPSPVRRPAHKQQIVLLTSGTTGTPKGAPRELGLSLAVPGGYLSRIPLRSRRTVLVAAPMFHAWGLLSTMIAAALGDTLILQRRFDPRSAAQALAEHDCDALITVPILLSRLLDAGTDLATPDLRVIAVSGSALSPALAAATMHRFGPVLYNLYGSTEVAYATIATPQDLLAAPGTVGRAPQGTRIAVLDDDGRPVGAGEIGRIFVGSTLQFEGYSGGGSKQTYRDLMATGDVGHVDSAGRLFVDGRDDDMIISGGENVYPAEIEELLATHPQIAEAAVIGVADPEFGQRLRAYVAVTPSATLSDDDVRDFVKQNLARYKVPREVRFVGSLPRNPAGKVVKRALPDA